MTTFKLTEDQEKANVAFTDFLLDKEQNFLVISGSAGTGKSTLVRHLLDTLHARMQLFSLLLADDENHQLDICVAATTNKAASVLADFLGYDVSTVHNKLGLVPRPNYTTGETDFIKGRNHQIIHNTLFIIDEASFISNSLFEDIKSSTVNCKIVLIGDQYQLAPVKQKIPIMNNPAFTRVSLNQIMRHGGAIAEAGARFKETVETGIFTPIVPNGEDILHVDGPTFQQMIDEEFTHPEYTPEKARILAWTNSRVNQYNAHIREINGLDEHPTAGETLITNKPIISNKGQTLYCTDSLVKIEYTGYSCAQQGVMGRYIAIKGINEAFLPDNQIDTMHLLKSLAKEKKWPNYFAIKQEWLDLRPIFASTVHKSQGSTYDTVYIDLTDIGKCNIASDVARLLYVAITRASKKVVLYGQLPLRYRGEQNERFTITEAEATAPAST